MAARWMDAGSFLERLEDSQEDEWERLFRQPADTCHYNSNRMHGTDSAYHNGCRCDSAREAHRVHTNKRNAEWRAFAYVNPWRMPDNRPESPPKPFSARDMGHG